MANLFVFQRRASWAAQTLQANLTVLITDRVLIDIACFLKQNKDFKPVE